MLLFQNTKFRSYFVLAIISILFLFLRLTNINSDYNIFDSQELFALNSQNSLYPFIVKCFHFFIPTYYLVLQRIISVFAMLISGWILVYYFRKNKIVNSELLLLAFLFNPLIFYYAKVGIALNFALMFLILAMFLFTCKKAQAFYLMPLILVLLVEPQLVYFLLVFIVLILCKIKMSNEIKPWQSWLIFTLPILLILSLNFQISLLILTVPSLLILIFIALEKIWPILVVIVIFSFYFTPQAYFSSQRNTLSQFSNYVLQLQERQYPDYPIYTTFNRDEFSKILNQKVEWFNSDGLKKGLLITDDINSKILDSPEKENAFLIYKNYISQDIEKKNMVESYSYFPFRYKNNFYRVYLLLGDEDKLRFGLK